MGQFGFASLVLAFALGSVSLSSAELPEQKSSDDPTPQKTESTDEKTVAELTRALKSQYHNVREKACFALAELGAKARPALPGLIEALEDREPDIRWKAAYAIGAIGPEALTALPKLIAAMDDRDDSLRSRAAEAIGRIGPNAKSAVPSLIKLLNDKDSSVRCSVAHAIGRIGPEAKSAVPSLIKLLNDKDSTVRDSAALAIGDIGPEAKSAVPSLIKLLNDEDSYVRGFAAHALGKIGPEAKSAVPALIKQLKDQDPHVRAWSAIALGDIGREPAVAVPALAAALKNEETPCRYFGSMAFYATPDVKRRIAESLSSFGKEAVPVLTDLLEHPSKEIRWCALYSLGEIGANAKSAAQAVRKRINNEEDKVASLAVSTYARIEPDSDQVIPQLIESLKSKCDGVRYMAAVKLGDFGPKARAAIPELLKVYNAHDIQIGGSTWAVGNAISRIDPDAARKEGIKGIKE